jgi:hypothetical protein
MTKCADAENSSSSVDSFILGVIENSIFEQAIEWLRLMIRVQMFIIETLTN